MRIRSLLSRQSAALRQFTAADAPAYPAPRLHKFAGLEVLVENPRGSQRSGVDKGGKPWRVTMAHDYGYLRRADGEDGEGLDVFLGPDEKAKDVYAIHQNTLATEGKPAQYDEDKLMIGFPSPEAAKAAYLANYDEKGPRLYRSMTILPLATFKKMLSKAEPGSVRWRRKLRRTHETTAVFSAAGLRFAHEQLGLFWRTIGGDAADGKKHVGGTHVLMDKEGTIHAGPAELEGKKVSELGKPKPETAKIAEPKKETSDDQRDIASGTSRNGGDGAGPVGEPVDGGGDRGGNTAADDERGKPKGRIVTARPHLTQEADPSIVAEQLRKHLNEHQVQGVAKSLHAMNTHGGFLLADSTGVGKTRQQLAVAKTYADQGKKVLIVTKAEVIKPNWDKQQITGSFKADSDAMGIPIKLNAGDAPLAPGEIHVTTYDRIAKIKDKVDRNTVLEFDESHSMKNYDSARSKHGMEMAKAADKVLFLTATPVDKPLHIAHLARAGIFGNRPPQDTYRELGLIQKELRIPNGKTIKKWEVSPAVGNAEVARRLNGLYDRMTEDGLMLRREISMDGVDVGIDRIAMPPEAHEAMSRVEDIVQSKYGSGGLAKALLLMHQRRQQEPYKIPHVVEGVKQELAEGRHVVVFVSRVNESEVGGDDPDDESVSSGGTAGMLKKALADAGINDVLELHGGVTPKARLKAMDDFQSGKGRVIVATIESGGTGINLDDTAGDKPRTMFIMTAPFSAVENVQAAGRIWRLKTASNARIRYVFGDTDVDAWNAGIISKKMKSLGAAVQGEVGKLDTMPASVKSAGIAGSDDPKAEPYKWGSLAGRGGGEEAREEGITPRRVQTRYGTKYVHDLPLNDSLQKLLNSPNRPRWLSEGEYQGQRKATVWGGSAAQVRDRVRQAESGKLPESVAPPPAEPNEPKAAAPHAGEPSPDKTVYLRGNTFTHKDAIRRMGFKWNPDKKAWYGKRSLIAGGLPSGVRESDYSADDDVSRLLRLLDSNRRLVAMMAKCA